MAGAQRGVFVGLATLDVIHLVDTTPGPNQKVTAQRQFVAAGGPAANAAVTFAALGGEAVLLTALGTGVVAESVRADLAAHGVRVLDAAPALVDAVPVSSIVVRQGTGERSIVSVDATGVTVPAPVGDHLLSIVDTADVVLVDGHHPAPALAAARRARAGGIPVVVDAGRWKPVFDDLVPLDPEFVCSADLRYPGTDDVRSSAAALRGRGLTTVVTTRGADPVLWWHGPDSGEVPVPQTHAVDTAGAGDAFHGAYAHARTEPSGIVERLGHAATVASRRVSVLGPREWLASIRPGRNE